VSRVSVSASLTHEHMCMYGRGYGHGSAWQSHLFDVVLEVAIGRVHLELRAVRRQRHAEHFQHVDVQDLEGVDEVKHRSARDEDALALQFLELLGHDDGTLEDDREFLSVGTRDQALLGGEEAARELDRGGTWGRGFLRIGALLACDRVLCDGNQKRATITGLAAAQQQQSQAMAAPLCSSRGQRGGRGRRRDATRREDAAREGDSLSRDGSSALTRNEQRLDALSWESSHERLRRATEKKKWISVHVLSREILLTR
jgi:hypothetical protein